MKTTIFAIVLLSAVAIAAPKDDQDFAEFMAKHNKSYQNANEMARRKSNWNSSKWKVAQLNSESQTATFDLNSTADMDDVEYLAMLGLDKNIEVRNLQDVGEEFVGASHGRQLQTTTIDWSVRPGGRANVFAVKNQGSCGSCWAFSALGVVEAMVSIKKTAANGGVRVAPERLSEQQQVDCTTGSAANVAKWGKNYGNAGCNGGWMTKAWNFTKEQGAMTNAAYPYTALQGTTCLHDPTKVVAKTTVYGTVTSANALARLQKGPLSIALAAGNSVWRFYRSGYLTSANLCPTALDHGVVLVGHETAPAGTQNCREATAAERAAIPPACTDGSSYLPATTTSKALCCKTSTVAQNVWVIQNSWGTGWGDKGFIKFAREDTGLGVCGMNQYIGWVDVL